MSKKKYNYVDRAIAHAHAVVDGVLPSCQMVVCACRRFLSDLERDDIWLDEKTASKACLFLEHFKHFKGAKAGQYLKLEDWQVFVFVNIFGWKRKDTGKRRFTYADILVPRKNGKTMVASGVALYMLFMDGEAGAEVFAAAVDKEQAKLCFDGSKELLRNSFIEEQAKVYRAEIKYPNGAGWYRPLSKDTKNKDGLNPHCAICDERHAWSTNEIYDLIKTGMGARTQPLLFSISTAGMDTSLPYYTDVQTYKDILLGVKEKDNHFILLYVPDEGDRFDDPNTWRKVNPNLGVSVSERYMEEECAEAKMKGGSTLASFCVKNLNMWVDAPSVWIADDIVQSNNRPLNADELLGEECYVGIDMARKTDITAVAFWFPRFKTLKYLFVVPEAKVQELQDRVDYRRWAEQGWIVVSPGAVLDEDWWMSTVLKQLDLYHVRAIAYDPWGMWNILPKFGKYSEVLMEYPQNIRYMSVPTKWFEAAVLRSELNFMQNPVIRWMMGNVVIYTDPNANIKLDKARARNKIDGVVASVDAIGAWLNKTSGKQEGMYERHSLRIV